MSSDLSVPDIPAVRSHSSPGRPRPPSGVVINSGSTSASGTGHSTSAPALPIQVSGSTSLDEFADAFSDIMTTDRAPARAGHSWIWRSTHHKQASQPQQNSGSSGSSRQRRASSEMHLTARATSPLPGNYTTTTPTVTGGPSASLPQSSPPPARPARNPARGQPRQGQTSPIPFTSTLPGAVTAPGLVGSGAQGRYSGSGGGAGDSASRAVQHALTTLGLIHPLHPPDARQQQQQQEQPQPPQRLTSATTNPVHPARARLIKPKNSRPSTASGARERKAVWDSSHAATSESTILTASATTTTATAVGTASPSAQLTRLSEHKDTPTKSTSTPRAPRLKRPSTSSGVPSQRYSPPGAMYSGLHFGTAATLVSGSDPAPIPPPPSTRRKSFAHRTPPVEHLRETLASAFRSDVFPAEEFGAVRLDGLGKASLSAATSASARPFATLQSVLAGKDSNFVMRGGARHHAFDGAKVPYPRSYAPDILDHDIWDASFYQRTTHSVTHHAFETPPKKILDLGCGTGTWILDAARTWTNSHFVGLDIVPVWPELKYLDDPELTARISWVQANFLEPLPFKDAEFDMVRMFRIAQAVPEDKWNSLFEEVSRVLTKGGALEVLEGDLYIPGKLISNGDNEEDVSSVHDTVETATDTTLLDHEEYFGRSMADISMGSLFVPGMSALSLGSGSVFSTQAPTPTSSGGDHTAHMHAPPMVPSPPVSGQHRTSSSMATANTNGVARMEQPPPNPRDHSLLDLVYAEMHAARFINTAPTSIMGSYVSLYFKDMRTHSTVNIFFPPKPRKQSPTNSPRSHKDTDLSAGSMPQESVGGVEDPKHQANRLPLQGMPPGPYVRLDDNLTSALSPSKHASFPALHLAADAPAFFGQSTLSAAAKAQNRLPNATVDFDIRTLNMHLAHATASVLACAEAMWDWIVHFQRTTRLRNVPLGILQQREPLRAALLVIQRPEFDKLLSNLDFDMQDYIGHATALESQFSWLKGQCVPSDERAAFDRACAAWDDWVRSQSPAPSPPHHGEGGSGLKSSSRSRSNSTTDHNSAPSLQSSTARAAPAGSPHEGADGPRTQWYVENDANVRRLSRSFRIFCAWNP